MSLAQQTEILLLDEPTTSLDLAHQEGLTLTGIGMTKREDADTAPKIPVFQTIPGGAAGADSGAPAGARFPARP